MVGFLPALNLDFEKIAEKKLSFAGVCYENHDDQLYLMVHWELLPWSICQTKIELECRLQKSFSFISHNSQ